MEGPRGGTHELRKPWGVPLSIVHTGGFFGAIGAYGLWSLVALVLYVLVLVLGTEVILWRRIVEPWTGAVAGVTFAIWLVRVLGYRDEGYPNVALAILLVAGEIILALLINAWRERGEAINR